MPKILKQKKFVKNKQNLCGFKDLVEKENFKQNPLL